VVLKENEAVSESELRGFLRARLADYKIPRKIEFLPELPKTSGGKIIKSDLEKVANRQVEVDVEGSLQLLNEIDRKLVELLNERAEISLKMRAILEPKKQTIFFPDYEESLIRSALEENKGPIYDESLEEIFEKIRSVIRML
jgi:chorismate mutase